VTILYIMTLMPLSFDIEITQMKLDELAEDILAIYRYKQEF
jgi:hypothetical protein